MEVVLKRLRGGPLMPSKRSVDKPRNCGTMSEAAYWGMIRSGLRRTFRYWKPIQEAKQEAKRSYSGPNKRQKWEYRCATCGEWFMDKDVQVDHIIPCGSLKKGGDLEGFVERLTTEDGFQILCKPCHKIKTESERV